MRNTFKSRIKEEISGAFENYPSPFKGTPLELPTTQRSVANVIEICKMRVSEYSLTLNITDKEVCDILDEVAEEITNEIIKRPK